jgi:hypothetical protein
MKIVQSFWSKPFLHADADENARFKGGWLHQRYHLYSWALSCCSFGQFYKQVELVTDTPGKALLIDLLELPYTKVTVALDDLQDYPTRLWALGKLKAYALQDEPFLHADSDVYIWKKIPEEVTAADVFAQNEEIDFPRYMEVFEVIRQQFAKVPPALVNVYNNSSRIMALNAGIIGGNDIDFFRAFTQQAFDLVNANLDKLETVDVGIFNMVYEQQLSYSMALEQNKHIRFLRNQVDASFSQVMDFHVLPVLDDYIHAVGYAKRMIYACEQVEARLRYQYPQVYARVSARLQAMPEPDEASITPLSEERYAYLTRLYEILAKSDWNDLLQRKYVLNPTTEIANDTNTGEPALMYYPPQTNKPELLELEGWNALLAHFEEPQSTASITAILLEDPDIAAVYTKEELEQKVFSFVMDKVMYTEVLLPEERLA